MTPPVPWGTPQILRVASTLASAPKSNASMRAIGAASNDVTEHGALAVPLHLRNAPTELMRREGYGKGYRYPHDHPDHFVREQYLPDLLKRARYYEPSDQGDEARLAERLRRLWGPNKSPEESS